MTEDPMNKIDMNKIDMSSKIETLPLDGRNFIPHAPLWMTPSTISA